MESASIDDVYTGRPIAIYKSSTAKAGIYGFCFECLVCVCARVTQNDRGLSGISM